MLKAIETTYRNYKYRSRQEARWAVFFDTLDIPYEYEKEGFELNGMFYLPDFWLPVQRYWIEVKGQEPTQHEQEKAAWLARCSGSPVYILWGTIECPDPNGSPFTSQKDWDDWVALHGDEVPPILSGIVGFEWQDGLDRGWPDLPITASPNCYSYSVVAWSECPHCGAIGIADLLFKTGLPCECPQMKGSSVLLDRTPRLVAAYRAARMARFEHGRSGN